MTERSETAERPDPHEVYGIQRVPRSRAEALGQIQAELQREIARRAGTYGRRLAELFETLEATQHAFDTGLETVRASAATRFGPQAARWPWRELVARTETLSPEARRPLESEVRAVEGHAERHKGLRAEVAAVRQHLIIHREAMGFRHHHLVEEKFPTPAALPPVEVAWRPPSYECETATSKLTE